MKSFRDQRQFRSWETAKSIGYFRPEQKIVSAGPLLTSARKGEKPLAPTTPFARKQKKRTYPR